MTHPVAASKDLVKGFAVTPRGEALTLEEAQALIAGEKRGNKYGAIRTWSELCQRYFASKAEARRGEELAMLQKAGQITKLGYQRAWLLTIGDNPPEGQVSYLSDFDYFEHGKLMVEDVKGKDTPTSRVKRAWLYDKYGVRVTLVGMERKGKKP